MTREPVDAPSLFQLVVVVTDPRDGEELEYVFSYHDLAPPVPGVGEMIEISVNPTGRHLALRRFLVARREFGYLNEASASDLPEARMQAWVTLYVTHGGRE